MRKLFGITAAVALLLLTWLFMGIALGFSDHETKAAFFIKKYPTFQIEFPNPDDSESDYYPFAELSPEKQADIRAYCMYRFGVSELSKIEACRQHAPINAGSYFLGLLF